MLNFDETSILWYFCIMPNVEKSLFDQCVSSMEERSIPSILNNGQAAGYGTTDVAVRYHSPEPIYSAVWMINAQEEAERDYSPAHVHDFPELNILAGAPGDLVYKIMIGDEEREVESPATILIPAGIPHSANIVRGFGAFVVVRLMPEQIAHSNTLVPSAD